MAADLVSHAAWPPTITAGALARWMLLLLLAAVSALGQRKCILVLGAHADDVEILGGASLAKYVHEDNYEGVYVVAINNTAGCLIEKAPNRSSVFTVSRSPKTYPAGGLETIQIRTEEARQAAAVLGAVPVFLNFREPELWQGRTDAYIGTDFFHQYDPPGRQVISVATRLRDDVKLVMDLLRQYQPEITIIHAMGGEKHDHANSGYLMYLAFRQAIQAHVPVGKLWMLPFGWINEPESEALGRGKPDVRVDVTNYVGMMYEALNKHVSQNSGLKKGSVKPGQKYYEEFITVIDNSTPKNRKPRPPKAWWE